MKSSVYSRALQKAARLLGGQDKLAAYLKVPIHDLRKWIAEEGKPPSKMFLRVVDLIVDELPPGGSSELNDAPEPRDCSSANQSTMY